MNILYSKKNMVNCFEGCAIGNFFNSEKGLIFFNKNIMKFYKLDNNNIPIFLFDKLLLENVIQLETYKIDENTDGIIILFESTKMSSMHFVDNNLVVNSLKFFERDSFDIRYKDEKFLRLDKNVGLLKISRRYFSIFSLDENGFPANAFCFTDIDERIKNVIDIVFLSNYTVPTFCIIFNSTPRSYINLTDNLAIVCSYDSKLNTFYVIDEYEVPTYTTKAIYSNDILVLISGNELVFRTTGSIFYYPLNKMSMYQKETSIKDFVIKDAQFYFEKEHLIIFNGDGLIYNIFINIDSGRIVDITFEGIETLTIPKYIYRRDNLLFLGSNEDSYLFEISFSCTNEENFKMDEVKKMRPNITELDQVINEEYEKLYGTTIDVLEKNRVYFNKLYVFQGIGYINDLCLRNEKEFLACAEGFTNHLVEFTNYLKFDIKKIFDCINYERIILYDNRMFVKKENKVYEIKGNLVIPEELNIALCTYQKDGINYIVTKNKIVNYKDNLNIGNEEFDFEVESVKFYLCDNILFLGIIDTKNILYLKNTNCKNHETFKGVSSFCFYENFCVLNIGNNLIFYNLTPDKNQWIIYDITNFNYKYIFDNTDETKQRGIYHKIVEMEIIKMRDHNFMFLINDNGHLAIYKLIGNGLSKILLEESISFVKQKSSRYFTKIDNFIHLNSRVPYFLYFNDRLEIFFYKSFLTIRDIHLDNGNCIFLIHDKLVNATFPKLLSNNLTKKSNLFQNITISSNDIFDRYIYRKIPVEKIPKSVEISGNYVLVVSSSKVKFKEIQEEENISDVYTQKYSIDLYTNSYKLISTFELEDDEYVFDIKEMQLNDSIGVKGKSDFIVVCVTKIEGEDKHSRGRLIVLELIDIVVDQINKYKDKKLKLIASENIKGCIIKCDEIKGNVIVALGIKTMVYKIDRSDGLIPIGIHDLNTLTTSLVTIKNFILSCDIYRGLSFFYYQKKPVRLNLICTSEPIQYATHVDFIVKGSSLGIICMDVEGNMHVYTYSPLNILSCDGTKFVKRCETRFNLGRLIMKRAHSKLAKPVFISDGNNIIELDTFSEETYHDILKCQSSYLTTLDDPFGLSSENFNSFDYHLKPPSLKKPILREVVVRFLNMPIDERVELIKEEKKIFGNI